MLRAIKRSLKERRQRQRNLRNIDNIIKEKIATQHWNHLALTSNTPIISHDNISDKEVILSFTTYGKRIHDIHLVLESLAYQTIKPNKVILWLDENEFSFDDIPLIVKNYINRGLEIKFCKNYKSYKKIIPTLINHPQSHIITIDDDIIYPHDMVEQLVNEHKVSPHIIIGQRAHKIKINKSSITPYKKWEKETTEIVPSNLIFITSGAGTFFPAKIFNNEILDENKFLTLASSADDVWLNAMAIYNNVKRKKVNDERDFSTRFITISHNQSMGLNKTNVDQNQNDIQLHNVLDTYKTIKESLFAE